MSNSSIQFSSEWLDSATWTLLDQVGALKRWRVADSGDNFSCLAVTGAFPHSPEARARLEREYALAPCIDAAWALVPRTLINTRHGLTLLLSSGNRCEPLSSQARAGLPVERFLRLAIAVSSALCEAHKAGVLHGDIRPEHLILSTHGSIKLTGFALATFKGRSPGIADNAIKPSLAYLAPERVGQLEQHATVQSDLYALGITFFQLLTGRLPFDAKSPVALLHQHLALEANFVTHWRPDIPISLGRMIARLLKKEPCQRSMSMEDVEAQLRRHLISWQDKPLLENATNSVSTPMNTEAPLVGREAELGMLRDSLHGLIQGRGGILLIQGDVGMGKTALVNVLEQAPMPAPYLLAKGKCEITENGFPYDALASALSTLCRRIASGTVFELRYWRQLLRNAIGPHGNIVMRLIPELETLAGPLSASVSARGNETRRHLHRTLQRLISTIATADHPLVLFLDDLQWIDRETLIFLKELDLQSYEHLLLIGTYRSGAADTNPELQSFIQHCRQLMCETKELTVGPFNAQAATALFASEFALDEKEQSLLEHHLAPHAQASPLYVNQAIAILRETRAVPSTATGSIDTIMHARFERLPVQSLDMLSKLAVLGSQTPTAIMATICGLSVAQTLVLLKPAFNAELITEHHQELRFTHDSIGEAARMRIPAAERQAMHLGYALIMAANLTSDTDRDTFFRIASQLLQVPIDKIAPSLRPGIISLLFRAAEFAKASVAASKAIDYLRLAYLLRQRLPEEERPSAQAMHILYVKSLILNGDHAEADAYLIERLGDNDFPVSRAEFYCLRCELYTLRGDYHGVIAIATEGLSSLGLMLSSTPTSQQAMAAWQSLQKTLEDRPLSIFLSLSPLQDARIRAILQLLAVAVVPGSFHAPQLMLTLSSHIVRLTLTYGMSASGVHGLAWLGVSIAHHFGKHQVGFDYVELAAQLGERPPFASQQGVAMIALAQVGAWIRPLPFALERAESAYRQSLTKGTPSFACLAMHHIVSDLLVMGAPIERILQQIDSGLELARHHEFEDAQTILYTQALYIRRLAGDDGFTIPIPTPAELARRAAASQMGPLRFWWELFEGLFHFLENSQTQAAKHLDNAWALVWAAPVNIHMIDLALFSVLNRAALQFQTGEAQNFEAPLRQLRLAAKSNHHYFADRLALAEAEIFRANGHHLDAIRHYEHAIDLANRCGAVHIQGLVHELKSRLLRSLDLHFGAQLHLQLARDVWRRWGAKKLSNQLEAAHDFLYGSMPPSSIDTPTSPQHMDTLAITTACQALSREIEPDALIRTLLTNATLHAGATYTALLLVEDEKPIIVATGSANQQGVDVCLSPEPDMAEQVPLNLVRHTLYERKPLAINGAEALTHFSDDGYLLRLEQASIACIPLLKQNTVLGLLYLENTLISGVFTPAKIDLLELLAAQAAISLRNAQLYRDLRDENVRRKASESKLSRTQAMLAIGQAVSRYSTFTWKPGSDQYLWTSALLDELGLHHPNRQRFLRDPKTLVCPDDREHFSKTLQHSLHSQSSFRLCFRTVPLTSGARDLEIAGEPDTEHGGFIGVVLDITERKKTESDLRSARSELERTSQATVLGELAASIAHEINQPLASILSNAAASIRWLDRPAPELQDALEGMHDILSEGQRAADIITAMRGLARQTPPRHQITALDEVIRHVMAIIKADLLDQNIKVVLELAPENMAWGDAIQIQQVLHNLIINAVEAMGALPASQRRLVISTQPIHDHTTLVIVQDSGPGIAPDEEASVFQAFYTTKPTGMGMGLAICSSIITAHGGVMGYTRGRESESLLFFTLPRPQPG